MPDSECKLILGGQEVAPPEQFKKYRKISLTEAVQMDQPFAVQTLEGRMDGQPGDYLMRGAHGELYPCAKAIFDDTYEPAPTGQGGPIT